MAACDTNRFQNEDRGGSSILTLADPVQEVEDEKPKYGDEASQPREQHDSDDPGHRIIWDIDTSNVSVRDAKAFWESESHGDSDSSSTRSATDETALTACSSFEEDTASTSGGGAAKKCSLASMASPNFYSVLSDDESEDECRSIDGKHRRTTSTSTTSTDEDTDTDGTESTLRKSNVPSALEVWSNILQNKQLDKTEILRQWTGRHTRGLEVSASRESRNRFTTRGRYWREKENKKTRRTRTQAVKHMMPWVEQAGRMDQCHCSICSPGSRRKLQNQECSEDEEKAAEPTVVLVDEEPATVVQECTNTCGEAAADERSTILREWNGARPPEHPPTRLFKSACQRWPPP